MAATRFDVRQSQIRTLLDQISATAIVGLDSALSSVNSELTPPGRIRASSPVSLVVHVDSGTVIDPNTFRVRSLPPINNVVPIFTGGTITFPSSSGGTIVVSPGTNGVLTCPSGQFVKVLVQLDQIGNLSVVVGTPAGSPAAAIMPIGNTSFLSLGYVVISNIGGVIQAITDANCAQFVGGGGSGGGSSIGGNKNYVSAYLASTSGGSPNTGNPDLENGSIAGWSLGHVTLTGNLPSGVPTFGSGASGNLSLAIESSGQLAGKYSLGYVSSAATTAGDFLASDALYIDAEDQAKILQFKLSYKAAINPNNANFSGTSANSFGIAIYDVTNSTWIIPAGVFNLVQGSGTGTCSGTFQTPSNMTQFRLVLFNANATSGAFTLFLDDFSVGPQALVFGPAVSDWTSYTLTVGATTTAPTPGGSASSSAKWRRVGDSMEILYQFTNASSAGSAGSGTYLFPIPSGYTIDTTKVNLQSHTNFSNPGNSLYTNLGGANIYATTFALRAMQGMVSAWDTSNLMLNIMYQSGSSSDVGTDTVTMADSAFTVSFFAKVPIVGWSSNTVMSNDTDTRIVDFSAINNGGSPGGSTNITWTTINKDSHGAFNNSTGVYTVPVAGDYWASFSYQYASSATAGSILRNGTIVAFGMPNNNATAYTLLTNLKAGDTISFQIGAALTFSSVNNGTYVAIGRLSGPAVIAASEEVAAIYRISTNNTSTAQFNYDTKVIDTHEAVTTGTSWKFTAPKTAYYIVNATWDAMAQVGDNMSIFKNGIEYVGLGTFNIAGPVVQNGSQLVQLNAGDYIDFRPRGGTSTTLNASVLTLNQISIHSR